LPEGEIVPDETNVPDETKYCKDCRFCKVTPISRLFGIWTWAKCTHPNAAKLSEKFEMLVSGRQNPLMYYYCSSQRMSGCGPEAKDFQPKETK
jgi:hypothetical protein